MLVGWCDHLDLIGGYTVEDVGEELWVDILAVVDATGEIQQRTSIISTSSNRSNECDCLEGRCTSQPVAVSVSLCDCVALTGCF